MSDEKERLGYRQLAPHPATIKNFAAILPDLERQGISLVPAPRLVW